MPTRDRPPTRRKIRAADVEVSGDMFDHAVHDANHKPAARKKTSPARNGKRHARR